MALGNYLAVKLQRHSIIPGSRLGLIVRKIELQGQGSISYILIFTPIYLGKISNELIL